MRQLKYSNNGPSMLQNQLKKQRRHSNENWNTIIIGNHLFRRQQIWSVINYLQKLNLFVIEVVVITFTFRYSLRFTIFLKLFVTLANWRTMALLVLYLTVIITIIITAKRCPLLDIFLPQSLPNRSILRHPRPTRSRSSLHFVGSLVKQRHPVRGFENFLAPLKISSESVVPPTGTWVWQYSEICR